MSTPTLIDIPHSLGRDEAIRRIRARIGELAKHIPGGMAEVRSEWVQEDRMALDVAALGQSVSATLDVADDVIRVRLVLPLLLSMMSGKIADVIRRKGETLLLGAD